MKALMIASILFFSLRAMSAEVGEDQKGECIYANQDTKVKVVEQESTKEETKKEESKNRSI